MDPGVAVVRGGRAGQAAWRLHLYGGARNKPFEPETLTTDVQMAAVCDMTDLRWLRLHHDSIRAHSTDIRANLLTGSNLVSHRQGGRQRDRDSWTDTGDSRHNDAADKNLYIRSGKNSFNPDVPAALRQRALDSWRKQ
jgi:hypothetical protein